MNISKLKKERKSLTEKTNGLLSELQDQETCSDQAQTEYKNYQDKMSRISSLIYEEEKVDIEDLLMRIFGQGHYGSRAVEMAMYDVIGRLQRN